VLVVASLSVLISTEVRPWAGAPRTSDPSPVPATTSRFSNGLATPALNFSNTTTIGSINQPGDPDAVAYDSVDKAIYVANAGANELSAISARTNTRTGNVTVGEIPVALAYDPTNDDIYVANLGSDNEANLSAANVSIVSGATERVVEWVPVGAVPGSLAYDPTNNTILVGEASGNISILSGDTGKVIAVDTVGEGYIGGLAYDPTNNTIFAANFLGNNVSILSASTGRVIGSVVVGINPEAVLYDPVNNRVYVANQLSSNVSIISGSTGRIVGSVKVGSEPTGFAFDPQDDVIYVTDHSSGTVSIVSGASENVLASVSVGGPGDCPGAGVYDAANAEVYVADLCASTLDVIANGYPVTVSESGLPPGVGWGVYTWNQNYALGSSSTYLTFLEANGTWNYSVVSDNTSYSAPVPHGTFSVNGAAASFHVNFTLLTFVVSFSETGIPSNTVWWVILTNGPRFASSESTLYFLEPNGSYSYSASATGYSSPSGNFTIRGPPTGPVTVHFSALPSSSAPSALGVSLLDYELIGAAAAVVAIGLVLVLVGRRRSTPP
jgi:YVTN family beta-propeller protein